MKRPLHYAAMVLACACSFVISTDTVFAQEFDVQTFDPAPGPYSIFTVERAKTAPDLTPAGHLYLNYASRPLVEVFEDERRRAIVDQQLAAHLSLGLGLIDRLQIDVAIPIYLINTGTVGGQEFTSSSVGDLVVKTKARLLGANDELPFGLGVGIDLSVPTGNAAEFVGASSVTARPKVIADLALGRAVFALNLGVRIEESRQISNLALGPGLTYGFGAEVELLDDFVFLGVEAFGSSPFEDFFARNTSPLEGLIGAKLMTPVGVAVTAGGGGGLLPGVGAPEFRAFIGLAYGQRTLREEPYIDPDPDGDGIPTGDDRCPHVPENLDGFQDEDGCPELDNDGDGIPNHLDRCPNVPEDFDGFQDEDGCPELDSDGDGIPDHLDACPYEPEDFDGFQDEDGCPEHDRDGDGIPDIEDHCPDEPGLEEDFGCPPAETRAVREATEIRILDVVNFETDKAVIMTDSFSLLDQVALILRTNPDVRKVEVGGHTDHRGRADYNQKLSEARAGAVRQYLIQKGIEPDRLTAVGYGFERPIDQGRDQAAMARNRRVEFKILEQDGVDEAGEEP